MNMTDRDVLSATILAEMSDLFDKNQSSPGWAAVCTVMDGKSVIVHNNLTLDEAKVFKQTMQELTGVPKAEDKPQHPFTTRLKELRKGVVPPMTQRDMAWEAGIGLDWYRKIEQVRAPKPSITTLVKIAGVFGLKGDDLRSFVRSYPKRR